MTGSSASWSVPNARLRSTVRRTPDRLTLGATTAGRQLIDPAPADGTPTPRTANIHGAMRFETGGYPRPQLRRDQWLSLDGQWEFALDPDSRWTRPDAVSWSDSIRVPFAPETPASGIGNTGFYRACWYRRTFEPPALGDRERLLLHFGAVDYRATVWVNGARVAEHEGGYTPFSADVTDALTPSGPQQIVLRAFDDPLDLTQPRGKQDWLLEPHAIWYPRTTGIWQTVWLERVPAASFASLRWGASVEDWQVVVSGRLAGDPRDDRRLRVRLSARHQVLADDAYSVDQDGSFARRIDLRDPGIDDARRALLWSPNSPTLIQAELTVLDARGEEIDRVRSYTALRSVGILGDRFLLNGRPIQLRFALDQGYWRESGLTAPDDAALRRDVILARRMGFNGVRKHQKIEDPRYLYWADALGLARRLVGELAPDSPACARAGARTGPLAETPRWCAVGPHPPSRARARCSVRRSTRSECARLRRSRPLRTRALVRTARTRTAHSAVRPPEKVATATRSAPARSRHAAAWR
jgi:Glycosyl hydrolases family 2, sugar binding domain